MMYPSLYCWFKLLFTTTTAIPVAQVAQLVAQLENYYLFGHYTSP